MVDFETLTADFPTFSVAEDSTWNGLNGFGAVRILGLFKLYKTFVAIFSDGETLKLAVAGKIFDLMEGDAKVYAITYLPFIKYIRLEQYGRTVFKSWYWFVERDDFWPENNIFLHVERVAKSEKQKKRSLLVWNERLAGRDPRRPEFSEKLNEVDSTKS